MPDGFSFPQIRQTAIPLPPPGMQDEVTLIRICRQFAETELGCWYRYVVTAGPDGENGHEADALDWPADTVTARWIEATPATSLDGLRAKALAYSAWHTAAFDDVPEDRDGQSTMLASLLHDLARVERDAIIAQLAERHGPLPDSYTANGMWLGLGAGA